ncbi:MAG: ABCB family ABC transporter ATP-binding protein/permease [Gammaproteobacteria bacterium]
MRGFARPTEDPHADRRDWQNLKNLLPYLWAYRGRVLVALVALILAKGANVGIPVVLKGIVDGLDVDDAALVALPVFLLAAYGALRLAASLFNELRDALFARVRFHAMRRVAREALAHLHALALRYHLERQTGAVSRDLERGTQSVSTLLNYMAFQILPVGVEFSLVAAILIGAYDWYFAVLIFGTVGLYVFFTVKVTNWRMHWRHEMNALDSEAGSQATDSLINFETVKYFGNEEHEVRRYDRTLSRWENAAVNSQVSMSALNFGQGAIIALGVTLIMIFASQQVVEGTMSLGDLVMVNALMLQLFIPLNFLGVVYRSIRYSLADMDRLFKLMERTPEIQDNSDARPLELREASIEFRDVHFHYNADRPILKGVSFAVPAGRKLAVVGASGAGKSTLARLAYRLYDVTGGEVRIGGVDVRSVTQDSLRESIAIVPQDTVLFNDSIYYNIEYARPGAGREEVERAARLAHIHDFIASLPQGYDTVVGERGLKLSGGEKQRVAIARAVLKGTPILVFDEATSSLDSRSERDILESLREVAQGHTALVIAHRLSTIVDADEILVMESGRICEKGTHEALLARNGAYAQMWRLQQKEEQAQGEEAAEPA